MLVLVKLFRLSFTIYVTRFCIFPIIFPFTTDHLLVWVWVLELYCPLVLASQFRFIDNKLLVSKLVVCG